MRPNQFVEELRRLSFKDVFNPYADRCIVHDLDDAPRRRRDSLRSMLEAARGRGVDSMWIGRDLGFRGGRRTGLAFTDDVTIGTHGERWAIAIERPTKGEVMHERSAGTIWNVLSQIKEPVFLWNVFPLHPHDADMPFSNRSHSSMERQVGEEILRQLICLLSPCRLIAIGNNAAHSARRLGLKQQVVQVRHPSYGGIKQFTAQISLLYQLRLQSQLNSSFGDSQRQLFPRPQEGAQRPVQSDRGSS